MKTRSDTQQGSEGEIKDGRHGELRSWQSCRLWKFGKSHKVCSLRKEFHFGENNSITLRKGKVSDKIKCYVQPWVARDRQEA